MSGKNADAAGSDGSTAAKKLGVVGLAAIVVSSMIGGGIYSLPQNMAEGAAVGAVAIAWLITGAGMYFIANTFRTLSAARPDLTAGIYMYAKEGFGNYAGFTVAWGYWLCQICGNVGYAVITMDALDYFFPGTFAGGNNWESIVGGSLLIWLFNFVVLSGVRQASKANAIATVCKLIPLAFFIVATLFVFKWSNFSSDVWGDVSGGGQKALGSVGSQVKSTMLVTLWAFIGIEGAVVLSGRARSQGDVGKATILGYVAGLAIFVMLSILPFGFMKQAQLAAVPNPSTAGILERIVGDWGGWLMNAGLIVSILGSWLAWTMITAEMPFAAAKDGTFPSAFGRENKNGSPNVSLWVSSILMQIAMLAVYFSNDAWNTMLSITGVLVLPPYLASTAFLWKFCRDRQSGADAGQRTRAMRWALVSGVVGSVYAVWLIYAAGLHYLLDSAVFLALGIPFYAWARRERGLAVFSKRERAFAVLLVLVAVYGVAKML